MKPLVSILIPAYNAGPWIAETLRSALNQTWPATEIIVVDDGSKDQTLEVARQVAPSNVIIATQKNQGAAAARNHAYSLSHGDYIQWLDADDLLAPDKIEHQVKALSRGTGPRTLHSGAWGRFFYRTRKAKFRPSPLWQDYSPVDWIVTKMLSGSHMQTATWLVSRELTERAGPWNENLLGDDDGEYFSRVQVASDKIIFTPESKVYYREVGTNRLSYTGRSRRRLDAQFLSIKMNLSYLLSIEDSDRTRAACVRYMQKYMFDFHPDCPDLVEAMQKLAMEMGGKLEYPRSKAKYLLIEKLFGWSIAKGAAFRLPQMKTRFFRNLDRLMYTLEARRQ